MITSRHVVLFTTIVSQAPSYSQWLQGGGLFPPLNNVEGGDGLVYRRHCPRTTSTPTSLTSSSSSFNLQQPPPLFTLHPLPLRSHLQYQPQLQFLQFLQLPPLHHSIPFNLHQLPPPPPSITLNLLQLPSLFTLLPLPPRPHLQYQPSIFDQPFSILLQDSI